MVCLLVVNGIVEYGAGAAMMVHAVVDVGHFNLVRMQYERANNVSKGLGVVDQS